MDFFNAGSWYKEEACTMFYKMGNLYFSPKKKNIGYFL